jgi:hypothetical protein
MQLPLPDACRFLWSDCICPARCRASGPGEAVRGAVAEAEEALRSAVAVCQRHSRETPNDPLAQQLWFQVLQVRGRRVAGQMPCSECQIGPAVPCWFR